MHLFQGLGLRCFFQLEIRVQTPGSSRDHNDVDVARNLLCLWHSSVWLCTSMSLCLSHSSRQPDYQESHPFHVDSIERCGNYTKSYTPTTSWIATICKEQQTYLKDAFDKRSERMIRKSTIANATAVYKSTENHLMFVHVRINLETKEGQSLNLVCMSAFCVV